MLNCNLKNRIREFERTLNSVSIASMSHGLYNPDKTSEQPTCDELAFSGDFNSSVASSTESSMMIDEILDLSSFSREERKRCFDQLERDGVYKYRFKNVHHVKNSHVYVPPSKTPIVFADRRDYRTGWNYGVLTFKGMPTDLCSSLSGAPSRANVPPIHESVSDEELARGFQRLNPSLDALNKGFSLANFIYELKDLKRLVQLPRQILNRDRVADSAASGFVGTNFGILPVVSDVRKAQAMMSSIDTYIDRWNSLAANKQIMDLHTTLFNFDSAETGEPFEVVETSLLSYKITDHSVYERSGKLHMYIMPEYIDKSQRIHFKFGQLDLDKPLGVAWEALPFSWFIDYFLNIQEWIEKIEGRFSPFKFKIVDAGYSIKNKSIHYGDVEVDYHPLNNIYCNPDDLGTVWIESSTYIRTRVSVPKAEGLYYRGDGWELFGSGITPHQSLLALGVGIGMRGIF